MHNQLQDLQASDTLLGVKNAMGMSQGWLIFVLRPIPLLFFGFLTTFIFDFHLLRKQDAVAGLCSKAACTQAPCQRRLSGIEVSLGLWPVVVACGSNMTLKRSDRVQMSADNALHAACQLCTCC